MNPPIIAFDIDGTWTLNPKAWAVVFQFLTSAGFQCIIVTGAEHPQDNLDRLMIPEEAVIVVSGRDLKEEAARKAGYNVAVWIDDMPGMIQNCKILGGDLE